MAVAWPHVVVLAAMAASIGVVVTAVVCVNYFYHDGVISMSLRRRGGLMDTAMQPHMIVDDAMTDITVLKKQEVWPKVVWLMSFPNRYV